MKLAELLRANRGDVQKINASDCIADAAKLLADHKIGALLVEDDKSTIAGIISERDIVRGMALHGADLHDISVSKLMTRDVIHCAPSDTVNAAMAMMTDRHIRHLPVIDGEDLVGFISIGDLVKCRIMEVQAETDAMRQYISSF